MPPRVMKRGAAARRNARATRESSKATTLQNHEAAEVVVMKEGNPVVEVDAKPEEKEEKSVAIVVEVKTIDVKINGEVETLWS